MLYVSENLFSPRQNVTLSAHWVVNMIRAIAFDLDDTLINTSGILAPKATLDAFKILKDNYMDKITICEKYKEKTDNIESTFHNQDEEDLVYNIEVIEELLKDGILLEKENELLERQNLLRKETKERLKGKTKEGKESKTN